jgi:hypothetical protein
MNLSDILPNSYKLVYKNKIRNRVFKSKADFFFYRSFLVDRAARRISRKTGIFPILSNANCGFIANMGYINN